MRKFFGLLMMLAMSMQTLLGNSPIKEGYMISGHVIEKETEEDIPYATILIVGSGQGTVSNEAGQFQFKNLEEGTYRLRVSAVGYRTLEKSIVVGREYMAVVHFPLEEEAVMVDEVVVSASRTEVSRRDAPVVVNILSPKLFEAVNSTDLAKTLNFQSGLRVENNCQNCGFPQVRINGLDGPYSQILINSRPIISALSGVYGLEQIPTNMIDRVEVVRGGGSALFGANAVGGTINIITKDPIDNSFQVSSTMSNLGGKSWEQYMGANVSLVAKDNSYGIALYQSYRNRNPYDHDGDSFSELGKLNMNTFGLRGYYRPSQSSRLNIEYHTTNELRRGGNKFDLQPHQTDITEQTKHIINSGGISYDHFWDEYKHKLSTYASLQHTDRDSYYGAQRDTAAYGKTNDLTWVAGAMYVGNYERFLFAPSVFTGGLEYQQNSLHDIMIGYQRDMQQDVRIASAFVQNEWKMQAFSLLAGGRIDRHNLIERPILSPRVNLLYKPQDRFQARLTYSTGFRAPQAYDEDLHVTAVGGEGVLIRLADGLREERSNSFSGSVDYTTTFGHWQANVLVEGFYTGLNDVFILEDIGHDANGYAIKERRNGNGARVYGANLDAKVAHGKEAVLSLGFTAQRSRYNTPEEWSEGQFTTRMMRTPDYYGYFTFTSAPAKNFDFSLSGTYTGDMIVPHYAGYIAEDRMETTPHFFDLNLKFNYTFILHDHIKLQVNTGVQNILNHFQPDLDQGEFRDSGYFYGPTQPRTLFIGFKIAN
ncbi:MAG: TonB-dependent receptor [Bacteroidaceae bacterium]|nr:TonB-dependent receptor [Bacteroidaceae bacterium]